jgi:hypothetical protein
MNPNRVKKGEVDEVFLATAREVIERQHKAKRPVHLHPTQARKNVEKGEEIVAKAQAKKEKGKK